jgi:hypothetical protein
MEITYQSGAKVILQGPCDYTVDSPRGGFLQVGKLTARVASGQWLVRRKRKAENQKSEIRNQKSRSPLATSHSPLFSIRTPTALVEDLGTEFGVEVSDAGETASHVFQGQVRLMVAGAGDEGRGTGNENLEPQIPNPKSQILLSAGQAAKVSGGDKLGITRLEKADVPSAFVRQLPPPGPVAIFEDNFDVSVPDGEVSRCFQARTYSFGNGKADAAVDAAPGVARLDCRADAKSAAIVELSNRWQYNFPAFSRNPTRIVFQLRSGGGGLKNPEGYPQRKWVGIRDALQEKLNPSPLAAPGFYVTLALDGRHPAIAAPTEQPGNIVFVDQEGKKHFLAGWDWADYDGDGPLTVSITLWTDGYAVDLEIGRAHV